MEYERFIIPFLFALLLGVIILLMLRHLKKKKEKIKFENSIQQEILDQFDYAEQQMKGGINNGNTNNKNKDPYSILWAIGQGEGVRRPSESVGTTEQTNINRSVLQQPVRRQDVPIRTTPSISEDTSSVRKSNQNNRRSILSRIRRRKARR